jgi:hypothetical protein
MAREKNFPFHLDNIEGHNDLISYNSWCIPIRGPAPANVLATISGIAALDLDTDDDLGTESKKEGDVYIMTLFGLKPTDTFVDGSAVVTLARVCSDDSTKGTFFDGDDVPVLFALDDVEVGLNEVKLVHIRVHIVVGGDIALDKIAFQANVLIHREQFASTDGCDY